MHFGQLDSQLFGACTRAFAGKAYHCSDGPGGFTRLALCERLVGQGHHVIAVMTNDKCKNDVRVSPALALIHGLKQEGISVRVFDPQGMEHPRRILTEVEFCGSALDDCSNADCVVIATGWPAFGDLDARTLAKVMTDRTIVDLRNLLDRQALAAQGLIVHSIGRTPRLSVRGAAAQIRPARASNAVRSPNLARAA
jgi:hypothetical protein